MTLRKVLKTSFRGNPNVGLYLYATDDYCLAGMEVPEEEYPRIAETLGVPVHRMSIAGTGLLGVFLTGTRKTLLVPTIVFDRELAILDKLGISYTILDVDYTALGNNILCGEKGVLVSPEFTEAERKRIDEALGMKSKQFALGDITVVGSSAIATTAGCLIHKAAKDFEVELVESTLQVPVTRGTINMGSGYVHGGIVANSTGMIVGDTSGGPEIVNAEEALRGGD